MSRESKTGIVYQIFNKIDGKIYIGQTWGTLDDRWKQHCRLGSSCVYLSHAIKKYGVTTFVRTMLTSVRTQKDLDDAETYWMLYYNSLERSSGYNLRDGGSCGKPSAETRKRQSDKQKSLWNDPIIHERRSLGVTRSWEDPIVRERYSSAHKKYYSDPEARARHSRACGGKPFICDQNGKIYQTLPDAARDLNLRSNHVYEVLRGGRRHTKGYTFRYETNLFKES